MAEPKRISELLEEALRNMNEKSNMDEAINKVLNTEEKEEGNEEDKKD